MKILVINNGITILRGASASLFCIFGGNNVMIGIYKITNKINHKSYIGQSTNIEKRWNNHLSSVNNTQDHCYNYPVYRAMRKYGVQNFSFEVLELCSSELLDEREQYWVSYFDTYKNGYNQTVGGNNPQSKVKDYIVDITNDLKLSTLSIAEIAKKYNMSYEMVQGINTGRHWARDIEYPIRKRQKAIVYRCKKCGIGISRNSCLCLECYRMLHDKPDRNTLKELIYNHSFEYIGNLFNVSGKCVSKWCKQYGLPYKRNDIKSYSYENWCLV